MPEPTNTMTVAAQWHFAISILGKRMRAISRETWGAPEADYTFEFVPYELILDAERPRVRVYYRDSQWRDQGWTRASADIDGYKWEAMDA